MPTKVFFSLVTVVLAAMDTMLSMAAGQPDWSVAISELAEMSPQTHECDVAIIGNGKDSDFSMRILLPDRAAGFFSHWSEVERRLAGSRCILWVMAGFDPADGSALVNAARGAGSTGPKDFYLFTAATKDEGEAVLSSVGRALVNVVAASPLEDNGSSLVVYTVTDDLVTLDVWNPERGEIYDREPFRRTSLN